MNAQTSTRANAPRRNPATDLALIATFAAVIAACALLPAIPITPSVPFTLQTFAVVLTGAVLGARRGFLAALLYLAVGAIGIPVFANGGAGLDSFVGATAGYLVSFPFAAAAAGFIVERIPRRGTAATTGLILLGTLAGVVVNHALGIVGLALLGGMSLGEAVVVDAVFLPFDALKALLAAIVATAVHRAFPNLLPRRGKAVGTANAATAGADAAGARAANAAAESVHAAGSEASATDTGEANADAANADAAAQPTGEGARGA